MAGNGGENNGTNGGASISAAATAVGSPENRFQQRERRRRWRVCWGGISCFGSQKGGKRVVPASRIPEGNNSGNRANGPQPNGMPNQATTITPSLLAPPSSPASFTNSALPSTAQSPSCFLSLSANSPGGPSNAMFATGPYANETQLVSPPVFSTFTTEPSTAPFTPPPELNHPTTPSSPDVPFAQFLSSSTRKSSYLTNDLQATYPLYPESPASSHISPISGTSGDGLSSSFTECEFPARWGTPISYPDSQRSQSPPSSRFFGLDTGPSRNFMLTQDSGFFYPATSAQFYLDQAHSGGRLSVSREADVQSSNGNGHQNRPSKNCKPDVEEIEAYRASFGFSADEIITTPHYVEISDDVLDDSFTMAPLASTKADIHVGTVPGMFSKREYVQTTETSPLHNRDLKSASDQAANCSNGLVPELCNGLKDVSGHKSAKQSDDTSDTSERHTEIMTDEEDIFSRMDNGKFGKRYQPGLSSSDAEIDYRRGRSVRERKTSWRD